jgi:hypothetical protein
MSEAISGTDTSTGPGCRFAHPGYKQATVGISAGRRRRRSKPESESARRATTTKDNVPWVNSSIVVDTDSMRGEVAGFRVHLHRSCRPCARRDPYAAAVGSGTWGDGFSHNLQRWLWGPAFAGTTCGESVPYRTGRTGAEICSVLSRSVMSTTVTIGAVSS